VAIRGSLGEASLPDVLQLLAMGKKTGCLGLTHGTDFGYIYFANGYVSHASIVNRALSTEEAVYMLFTWSYGTFNFEPGVTPDESVPLASIDPQGLLLEGARRVDEWTLIAKKIPTFDVVYALDRQKLLESSYELTPEQELLISLIDGQRDIRALIADAGLGEFAAGKALYGLLTASFVVRVGVNQRGRPAVQANDKVVEHRTLGIAFYKTGMYDEAAREFRRVVSLRPDDPEALFYLGLVALRQQQWPVAAHAFEELAAHGIPRVSVYVNLAYAYERMRSFDQAKIAIDQALSCGGRGDARVQTNAAALAIAVGDHEQADGALAAARAIYGIRRPSAAWYHYAGVNAALTNDLDRAIAVLVEAVQAYPAYAVLWNNLALAYESQGRHDEAMQTLERGLVEDPTLPQLHRNFADCLQHSGRFDEAREAYRRAHTFDTPLL
jgi:tetratricopeptide (TPR) repeat protein